MRPSASQIWEDYSSVTTCSEDCKMRSARQQTLREVSAGVDARPVYRSSRTCTWSESAFWSPCLSYDFQVLQPQGRYVLVRHLRALEVEILKVLQLLQGRSVPHVRVAVGEPCQVPPAPQDPSLRHVPLHQERPSHLHS